MIHKVDLEGHEASFGGIGSSGPLANDKHKDCAHFASSASGKSNRWPRAVPVLFSRVSSSDRQRGSSIFFQRPKPGFWDFTAAKIASRSISGSLIPGSTKFGLVYFIALGLNLVTELQLLRWRDRRRPTLSDVRHCL